MPIMSTAPVIEVDGTALSAVAQGALVGLRIDRALGVIGRATLRFSDPGYQLASSPTFGVGAVVTIARSAGPALFRGEITGVGLEQATGEQVELTVVADDAAYKLSRNSRVQTFLNATYGDVITKLAAAAGVRSSVSDAPSSVNDFLIQAGSDLAYVDELARRAGLVWFVDTAGTLIVRKPTIGADRASLTLGADLREFSVRASALRPSDVTVSGWDVAQTAAIVGRSEPGPNRTGAAFLAQFEPGSTPLGRATTATAEWNPASADEAKTIAGALYDAWSAQAVVARGTCEINGAVQPGGGVRIVDAGPSSGTFYVAEVQHIYRSSGFVTRFTAGPLRPGGLAESFGRVPGGVGFDAPGLVLGVVTDVDDPDAAGRCKVKYVSVAGEVDSTWARVLSMGGGSKRGVVFQPEVNDEVLVGFEHSDMRRPVVLGGLFSQKNALPTAGSGVVGQNVDFRRITSRLGHVIEFGDGAGPTEQHISLMLANGSHVIRLGEDQLEIAVAAGKPVSISAGAAKFEITDAGDVTVQGKNVTIKADVQLNLEGTTTTVKGTTQLNVQGALVGVKSDGVTQVEASGPLTLKGAVVAIN